MTAGGASVTPGDHPADALSALLDGELAPGEERLVQAHLVGCHACRAELDRVRLARMWVRALPPVDPPFGMYRRLLEPYRPGRRRVAMALVGAAAAVAAAVFSVRPPPQEPVDPSVAILIEAHAVSAPGGGDLLGSLAPAGVMVSVPQ